MREPIRPSTNQSDICFAGRVTGMVVAHLNTLGERKVRDR